MKGMKHLLYGTSVAVLGSALPMIARAQGPFEKAKSDLGDVGTAAQIESGRTLPQMVGLIINVVLSFLGIVLLVYLIWGGFKWMTSGGSEEGVKEAKTMIRNAIIGLIIIVASYAIAGFVLDALINVV
jgi:hypothetical protein